MSQTHKGYLHIHYVHTGTERQKQPFLKNSTVTSDFMKDTTSIRNYKLVDAIKNFCHEQLDFPSLKNSTIILDTFPLHHVFPL